MKKNFLKGAALAAMVFAGFGVAMVATIETGGADLGGSVQSDMTSTQIVLVGADSGTTSEGSGDSSGGDSSGGTAAQLNNFMKSITGGTESN